MRWLRVLLVVALLALGACGGDGGDDGGGSAAGFCDAQAQNQRALASQRPTGDRAQLQELYRQLDDGLDRAVERAPGEISDDLQTVAGAYKPFLQELRRVDYDFAKLNFQSPVFQRLQSQDVQAAATRISEYYEKACA